MDRLRRFWLSLGLSASLVIIPAVALALSDVTYSLAGIETAATATQGTFVGVATTTDDVATWTAVVNHAGLPTTIGTTSAITGGTFALDGLVRDFAGPIDGGTITFTGVSPGSCGRQFYNVSGHLVVGVGPIDANFDTTLVHFRRRVFGACVTVFATVSGLVTFHNVP